ncbi:MFS transporter [Plantactinospora sonchi]|uniref:MFS transporter n=1 Tax=Plantactinospora sonchi TaxID=1544735 RepID=A0ABU7S3R4_9ACTN
MTVPSGAERGSPGRPASAAPPGTGAAIVPIIISGVFGITLGISYPLLAMMLERQGVSETVMGVNGAMTPLGMVLAAPLVPPMVRLLGPWRVMVAATVGVSVLLVAVGLTESLWLWFPLRFVLGICTVALFILSETWIGAIAGASNRGQLLTAYTSVLALGFSVGPAVLAVSDGSVTAGLLVAVASPVLALVPLWWARDRVPQMLVDGGIPLRPLARALSVLLVAVLAVSVFDSVTLQFLPMYGTQSGLSTALAALSLTVLLIGQVVFQYPLGWFADRLGARSALMVSLVAGGVGALLLPAAVSNGFWYWPLVAVWGGAAFAGYPLVLAILGESLPGESLLLGNTAFAIVWGVGGVIGPPYVGAAMDWLGASGLPWSLAALWAVALGVTIVGLRRGIRSGQRGAADVVRL